MADAIAGGSLVIGDNTLSGATGVLAAVALNATAATVSGPVLTIAGVPLTTTAIAGIPALAELRNNSGSTIVSGLTVGTSGTDIIVSLSPFTSGGTITVVAGTITHA